MVSDNDIVEWFKELGMKVERVREEGLYFHITVAPPMGGPPVSIIRPNPNSTYYIIAMILDVDQEKLSDEKLRKSIIIELARMNVEFFMTPADKPSHIQIAKVLFIEGLTKNELLNAVTLIKDASLLVYNILY
ncbi:MAG: DUF2299 family protein [Sulfolobus sp.]|nr:DUF2299 family protein [Sulfolobus sp.]